MNAPLDGYQVTANPERQQVVPPSPDMYTKDFSAHRNFIASAISAALKRPETSELMPNTQLTSQYDDAMDLLEWLMGPGALEESHYPSLEDIEETLAKVPEDVLRKIAGWKYPTLLIVPPISMGEIERQVKYTPDDQSFAGITNFTSIEGGETKEYELAIVEGMPMEKPLGAKVFANLLTRAIKMRHRMAMEGFSPINPQEFVLMKLRHYNDNTFGAEELSSETYEETLHADAVTHESTPTLLNADELTTNSTSVEMGCGDNGLIELDTVGNDREWPDKYVMRRSLRLKIERAQQPKTGN